MILFPAIDIRNGNCVRLIQGDYNKEQIYGDNPVEMAKQWQDKGAEFIHIVDLDGAKTGDSINSKVIQDIAKALDIPVQVGGGIRSMDIVREHLDHGVNRVIIGTAAIRNPVFLKEAVSTYGDKIAVSIDARNGFVATDGWTESSEVKAVDLVKDLADIGVKTIVYTDILKDGMLQGPNFEELLTMNDASSIDVIASGGVSTVQDVQKLRKMNMYGAIVGKALYDGTVEFEALLGAE